MWCDDFDLDLSKILPDTPEILGATADVRLTTHGGRWAGVLNHPSVWACGRGLQAFFGFRRPVLPDGYSTDSPIVACSFLEAMRDCWAHHYSIVVEGRLIWNSCELYLDFDRLMSHERGWRHLSSRGVKRSKARVRNSVRLATLRFGRLHGATLAHQCPNTKPALLTSVHAAFCWLVESSLTVRCGLSSFRQRPRCKLFGCELSHGPWCVRCGVYEGSHIEGHLRLAIAEVIEGLRNLRRHVAHRCAVCRKWIPFSADYCCSDVCYRQSDIPF